MSFLPLLGFWTPGPLELGLIALLGLLLFGRRLPEIMRGLGGSMREFRKGMEEGHEPHDDKPAIDSKPADRADEPRPTDGADAPASPSSPADDEEDKS